ncbi:Translation-associated RNA-binding protein [Perkinsela sp. CCAP 1560/4]|nr:Translation-associated RNA-binding protein [Perkinsela sp. CCAP 1560/4]|eukprot:KNH08891.1 Translation-associated RNA-binding protein [Perkinsela sp. CCAP 1560/4]
MSENTPVNPEALGHFIRKFSAADIMSTGNTQSSVQRKIRSSIQKQFSFNDDEMEVVLPKKVGLTLIKCGCHVSCVVVSNEILFFQHRSGEFYPHLRVLHRFPHILPKIQCDGGACKFVLSGANVMCPGVTSSGGKIFDNLEKGQIVQICIQGKEHAAGIGKLLMSTGDIQSINKGHGIETVHVLNDGMWKLNKVL